MSLPSIDRRNVLPSLIASPENYLIISGLAGAAKDTAALTDDGPNSFSMAGAMGASISIGLGVSISAPNKKVMVIAGDGEILMNLGSIATVATVYPRNLSIICMDNGCHGETGGQHGHTSIRTNLEKIALGAGFKSTLTISKKNELQKGKKFLQVADGPKFLVVKISKGLSKQYKRNLDPADCRLRFKNFFLKQKISIVEK